MVKAEVEEQDFVSSFSHRPPRPNCLDRPCFFLTGLPGCGKTAVGRALAEKLGVEFVDVAEEVGTGADEADVLRKAADRGDVVVAASAESVLDQEKREFMRSSGRVMYLMASVPSLLARLRDRLPGGDPDSAREILAGMLVEREPLFHECLHLMIPADASLEEVVESALDKARL